MPHVESSHASGIRTLVAVRKQQETIVLETKKNFFLNSLISPRKRMERSSEFSFLSEVITFGKSATLKFDREYADI